VEHADVHTDVQYEESRSLLRESREVRVDSRVLDAALKWGQKTFPGELSVFRGNSAVFLFGDPEDYGSTFKVKPAASVKFAFNSLANGGEYLESIIIRYIRPEAYSGGAMEIAIVDIVDGYPIPDKWEELEEEIRHKYTKDDSKFLRFFRRLKFFPRIREAFEGFMERLFLTVEREDVHTAAGATYEEARLTEAVIKITYAVMTPESAEEGDYAERGWVDEQGHDCEPDEWDREEGLDRVDLAVKFLQDEGASFGYREILTRIAGSRLRNGRDND
jgi:hypothetical protein